MTRPAGSAPKSVSHEDTFNEDTRDQTRLESTLAHLAEKVGRRLRIHGLKAITIQLKLRHTDFSTGVVHHVLGAFIVDASKAKALIEPTRPGVGDIDTQPDRLPASQKVLNH